jgi:hypothetical protein
MVHIDLARLVELSKQAFISNEEEAAHLRQCEECSTLLRILARRHRESLLSGGRLPPDDEESESP